MVVGPVVHVVGARPNFVKAAPVFSALSALGVVQRLVHTGQHYDPAMSDVFFADLDLPEPDANLGVGSGSHATQTAALLVGLEHAFEELVPSLVVVYGDVNSTLAAALVAAKLHVPVAHVEAGLRSFDASMPEEINRRLTDQLAQLLFATSPEALVHLGNEGIPADRVHFVGNPMIDTLLRHRHRLDPARERARLALPDRYGVVTMHRPANVDRPEDAVRLVDALVAASEDVALVWPLHPRSREGLRRAGLQEREGLRLSDPLGYLDFLSLVSGAAVVITDSGGIQEETTVLGVPCLTVRESTERPITITAGTNRLVRPDEVVESVRRILFDEGPRPAGDGPPLWDGRAGERIADVLVSWSSPA